MHLWRTGDAQTRHTYPLNSTNCLWGIKILYDAPAALHTPVYVFSTTCTTFCHHVVYDFDIWVPHAGLPIFRLPFPHVKEVVTKA